MSVFVLGEGDDGVEFVTAGFGVGEGDAGVFDVGDFGHGRECVGASMKVRMNALMSK